MTVAAVASMGVWGVGISAGQKFRETAATMALALAVAQSTGKGAKMAVSYPEFASFADTMGFSVGGPAAKKPKVEEA